MRIYGNVVEAIGRTPLIKLRKASELTGANIYGKAEFLNPGQSVKDRAALGMMAAWGSSAWAQTIESVLRPGDVMLDAGAHIGIIAMAAAATAPRDLRFFCCPFHVHASGPTR